VPCFVLATCGLEPLAAAEFAELPGASVRELGYRRIAGQAPPRALLGLRLVDDVFLDLGSWPEISHTRAALPRLGEIASVLPLQAALATIAAVRTLPSPASLAISISFVGRRNYSSPEIRAAVGEGLLRGAGRGLVLVERDDQASLGLRLFIDHERLHAGLRLGAAPAHQRPYQRWHRPGALRAPIAAALGRVAGVAAGDLVADPCCGTGTLLAEAAAQGALVIGADLDAGALASAGAALRALGAAPRLWRGDVAAMPVADGALDALIANLPWDRQVAVDERGARLLHQQVARSAARTLRRGGSAALLTTQPGWLELAGAEHRELSCSGARPTLVRWIRP
jgi:tRNA (guanine6-N2)-methyltransferase